MKCEIKNTVGVDIAFPCEPFTAHWLVLRNQPAAPKRPTLRNSALGHVIISPLNLVDQKVVGINQAVFLLLSISVESFLC